ncbi:LysR family transcriptional regulator [Pseudorhodoferax sp. Leaf267]|uniref:LysR family transcriptional regulator n=1 Tax=Pseudorhodoferax sp. Leaf267 TaxID=1736316 RepID=UPI00138F2067|nr:LysR family transcriptional regulator [Pseudorhodoferax sp. Leaf267]
MTPTDAAAVLAALDLRQLRFLLALLRSASITQAGAAAGLSQPAASRTMARLRKILGDALLVRTRAGFVLTPRAQALHDPLDRALAALHEALLPSPFVPAHSTRVFRLASTDYGVSVLAERCLSLLAHEAPHIGLSVDPWSSNTLRQLEHGALDVALFADDALPGAFHFRTLFREHYALLGPAQHAVWARLPPGPVDLDGLRLARAHAHVAVRHPQGNGHATDDPYQRVGLPGPRMRLELPYFSFGAQAIAQAGLLALWPQRMVRSWAADPALVVRPVAVPELAFDYRLIWHDRSHRDAAGGWLRGMLAQALA